jgi:MFS family permease
MYVSAVTAVGYWFEKKRSLVTGISTCGSGFGTIVFAPVVTGLEAGLGWQWCNRIVAGFCLAVRETSFTQLCIYIIEFLLLISVPCWEPP